MWDRYYMTRFARQQSRCAVKQWGASYWSRWSQHSRCKRSVARLLVWLGSEQVKDKPKIRAFLSLLRGKWSWLANSIWSVSLLGDNRLTVCGLCDKISGNKMIGNSVEIQRREKGKRAIAAWMWKWEFVENFVRYWLNTLSVKGAVKKESENFSP